MGCTSGLYWGALWGVVGMYWGGVVGCTRGVLGSA